MAAAEPDIFLSVAEASADLFGAGLVRAYMARSPRSRFWGLTGPGTRDAGCETFHDMASRSAMLLGVIARVPEALLMLRRLKRRLRERPPAAAVLIDSPTLNLPIAGICRGLNIPVLYYVAPQTWAWKERRVRIIRERVTRLLTILPFEEAYFRGHGINARFVGHPLFEALEARTPDAARVDRYRSDGDPVVVLLPGSRAQVVREVFPGQCQVAARIRARHPGAVFLVASARTQTEDLARQILNQSIRGGLALPAECVHFDHRFRDEMLLAADLALVASGTVTLEAAYRATPMIVMYNHGRYWYPLIRSALGLFGKRLLNTKYLSLPNILAGRAIVPEFMPYYTRIDPIAETALAMLADPPALDAKQRELAALIAPLVRRDVSETVAEELRTVINDR